MSNVTGQSNIVRSSIYCLLMKGVSFALLAAVGMVTASARAEIVENTSVSGPKTTVRYALWGGADEVASTRNLAQRFVKTHPDIRLDIGVYPWGQYWAKLQTQMASGLAPDVMQFFSGSFGVWVARGALMPLDKLAEKSAYRLDDFFPVTIENCRWNNHLYALPTDIAGWSVVYSTDLLEQSGIPKSEWPKSDQSLSWEQFQSLAKKLTLRNPDGTVAQYGMSAGQNWNLTISGKDGSDFVDRPVDPTRSTVAGNDRLAKSLIELFQSEYGDATTLGPKPLSAGAFTVNSDSLLLNSKIAMGTTGPWALKELKNAGVHFGLTPVPHGTGDHALINVNSLAIFAGCKHPDEAWEFVQYMTSNQVTGERASRLGGIPPRKGAVQSFLKNEYGIPGCEAFIHDMSVASPALTAGITTVAKVRDDWLSGTEETIAGEYERRLAALPKPISSQKYAQFVSGMNTFIEKCVRDRLPNLDSGIRAAIQEDQPKHSSAFVRQVLPAATLIGNLLLAGFYLRGISRERQDDSAKATSRITRGGALFLTPWLIGLTCFVVGPILASVLLSFTNWNMISSPQWVGFQHYLDLASDAKFLTGIRITFTYAAIAIPISLAGGLFTAGLLTTGIRGADFFKALIYFPALFTGAETAVLWTNMLNKDHGVLNYILSWLHISGPDWMDSGHAFYSVLLMNVFWVGGAMIVYYAGMKQIPQALFEAAELDGASAARKFRSITIPMLSPVILFMVVMTTIGSFQVFTPALFFAGSSTEIGAPNDSLRFYAVNIYDKAFNNLQMGEACCYAIILFLIIFAITYGQLKLAKRFVHTEAN